MVLCDHCDAMYGFRCLKPPLKKLPTGIWHCPDCKPRLKSARGLRMMSATAEQAARKRAELGDTPKKQVKQKMFLVKWAGLGYEYCTWETKADVSNSALIAAYHKLNNSFSDEPDLPEDALNTFLDTSKHINASNAGGNNCIPDLRSELYAQSRAFQFAKFANEIPEKVCSECGPKTIASCVKTNSSDHPKEVVECLTDLVYRVSWKDSLKQLMNMNSCLPPLMTGEYDSVLPITSKGLMMNVGEIHGSVAFLGYRAFPDGSKGPAEKNNLIRNVGDKIIAVDGVSTVSKSFKEVILLLRESGKNKYAFMRFLENKYAVCNRDLASVGQMGRYAIEELKTKFTTDRKRLLVQRSDQLLEEDTGKGKDGADSDASAGSDSDAEAEGSEGEFEPDSDDEEVVANPSSKTKNSPTEKEATQEQAGGSSSTVARNTDAIAAKPTSDGQQTAQVGSTSDSTIGPVEDKKTTDGQSGPPSTTKDGEAPAPLTNESMETGAGADSLIIRPETTHSLAYRLLDIDVGHSSDEGGDDECAYFVDGVDDTFTALDEIPEDVVELSEKSQDLQQSKKDDSKNGAVETPNLPARRNDFNSLGDRSKLIASVALSSRPPDYEEFESFPQNAVKKVEAQNAGDGDAADAEDQETESPGKPVKRSTVKVDQIDTSTNETVHVWANAESAAATLQIPLNEIKQVLRGDYDEDLGDEVGGFRWRFAAAGATITAGAESKKKGSKKGKEAWLEFRDRLYDPNEPHAYKNGNRLRDYQIEGVNWLASTYYRKHGCILADEMGLGKTVQIVSYLEHMYRVEKIQRPFLVVVPLSTVEHWRREFEGWTDMICCVYHDRQRVWRDVLREYEWYYEDRPHTADFLKFDVLVTTYDTLIGDFDVINQIPFRAAVVDEAHRLRNQKGKLLECMKEISAKGTLQYGFQSRVLMSGTPLQNDLNELWTLLNFIEPFKFPDVDDFMSHFGNMASKEQVEALQKKISPFMLRRVKEDVAKDIPAKEETLIDVELTSIQKQYYRAIFEHNHAFLNMGSTRSTAPKLMNIQMELRKVCNHPCLLDGVEHREQDKQFKEFLEAGAFENKGPEEQQQMLNEHLYIMTSGKMVLLDKLLPKLRQEGHKVLVFSQMVKMLDLISEYCDFRNFPYERLDGRVRGADRQKSIDRFEREENSFLFLLSTRAGGVGINLTAADVCIIFDSDWNPQNDVQAQARCHRIGQTKDVRIYRLITSRSFEQEMFDRASRKLGLEQAVLGSFGADDDDDKPTNKEMEQLLKKGAYALLEDDNDEVTKAFCADDIESILAKRTRTRVVEGNKTASWLNKQGMVVSKSKFTSDSKSAGLEVDDPLFWQKVMPDFVTPSIMLQKLNDLSDEILGTSGKGKGRGRGRGRWKKKQEPTETTGGEGKKTAADGSEEGKKETEAGADNEDNEKAGDDPAVAEDANDDDAVDEDGKYQLTRTNQRKVAKYMADLKSMLEGLFDEADEDSLPQDEKATAQNLMLTISVKDKLFNEEQRHFARATLKRLEGNRRRRCRTSDKVTRFSPGKRGKVEEPNEIREELRIVGKKVKKRRKRGEIEGGSERKRRRKNSDDEDSGADDVYLVHSDDEADWSDIGDDLYQGKKRPVISRKEARRRRQWAADDDAATAAGRAWPALPRNVVGKVLGTLLDEVIKQDDEKGGVFSVPVPRDEFPEYYEQIKNPIDYGSMKKKLDGGEYRSAQAMQKDFVLVMQNCLKFNSADSEIVQEARQQALLRPNLLRNAATKHDLFLAEDGSILEIRDDDAKKQSKGVVDGTPVKRRRRKKSEMANGDGDSTPIPRKRRGRKKVESNDEELQVEEEEDDVPLTSLRKKKPRIKISLSEGDPARSDKAKKSRLSLKGSSGKAENKDAEGSGQLDEPPVPRKKRRRSTKESAVENVETPDPIPKRRGRTRKVEVADEIEDAGEASDDSSSKRNGRNRTEPPPSRKKSSRLHRNSPADAPDEENVKLDFFNVSSWKLEREALDDSFDSARKHFTSRGAWTLPPDLNPGKFRDVAMITINKIGRYV
jgi:SNF2 family DNA or RNA helicase